MARFPRYNARSKVYRPRSRFVDERVSFRSGRSLRRDRADKRYNRYEPVRLAVSCKRPVLPQRVALLIANARECHIAGFHVTRKEQSEIYEFLCCE